MTSKRLRKALKAWSNNYDGLSKPPVSVELLAAWEAEPDTERTRCPDCTKSVHYRIAAARDAVIEAAKAWTEAVAEEREWMATQKNLKMNKNLERIFLAVEALAAAEKTD